jgi:GntR family transcriptional regulator, carbon starvation induced regulator
MHHVQMSNFSTPAGEDPRDQLVETLADQAEAVLQREILSGGLAADARLTITTLQERFGLGATPLREGLSRLITTGLVTLVGNRGFRVAPMNMSDLIDITASRAVIEAGAIRLAMQQRDVTWESGVLAAMHRLRRVLQRINGSVNLDNVEFDQAHRAFHLALTSGARQSRLQVFQSALYDQTYRYHRQLSKSGMVPQEVIEEHQLLVDLVLGADTDAACRAVEKHVEQTLQLLYPEAGATRPQSA